jgi:MFS family permease
VLIALVGGLVAEREGVGAILLPLAAVQSLAVVAALLIRERVETPAHSAPTSPHRGDTETPTQSVLRGHRDYTLWMFVAAMVLFHVANAPGGVYLGLFLKRDLDAPDRYLSYAFVVSMLAWMLAVRPVGWVSDRLGRRPLLIAGWATMALRLVLVALAVNPGQILAIQILDGLAQSFFAVVAAAWVTDRLADDRRVGEAQVLVGTSLVFGSAVGPILAGLVVEALGYRGMFGLLAGVGLAATIIVVFFIPETVKGKAACPVMHSRSSTETISPSCTAPRQTAGRSSSSLTRGTSYSVRGPNTSSTDPTRSGRGCGLRTPSKR